MTVEIRISGVKRFEAKNKELSAYIRNKYAPELAEKGYHYAKRIAPKDTGALIRSIRRPEKGKRSAKITLVQPNRRGNASRPYHLWMHGIKAPGPEGKGYDLSKPFKNWKTGKMSRIYSGNPKFMFATADYIKQIYDETFKKRKK